MALSLAQFQNLFHLLQAGSEHTFYSFDRAISSLRKDVIDNPCFPPETPEQPLKLIFFA